MSDTLRQLPFANSSHCYLGKFMSLSFNLGYPFLFAGSCFVFVLPFALSLGITALCPCKAHTPCLSPAKPMSDRVHAANSRHETGARFAIISLQATRRSKTTPPRQGFIPTAPESDDPEIQVAVSCLRRRWLGTVDIPALHSLSSVLSEILRWVATF